MKKTATEILSVFLAIVLTALMLPVSVNAASLFDERINELRSKFPDGAFWNHFVNDASQLTDNMSKWDHTFADSVTDRPCATHNGNPAIGVGQCDCNCFDGGIQCFGFANRIFYGIFGVYASQQEIRYDTGNVSAGDWIRLENDNHSAVVLSRNGDTLTIVEGNFDEYCKIKWDRQVNIGSLNYFKHASNYNDIVNGSHTHQYTEYVYYWKAHPHYKCYKCSCGEIKENRDEPTFLADCPECLDSVRPGKASIKEVKETYGKDEEIVFEWDDSDPNATHYSLYIDKLVDGEYKWHTGEQYAENGKYVGTLEPGQYQVRLIAYNSNYQEADKSDWLHAEYDKIDFEVTDAPQECEHQWDDGVVTKEPTCNETGEKTFTCALCGETMPEPIPATGEHEFGEWTVTKAASAEENGEEERVCAVCGKTETRPIAAPSAETVIFAADSVEADEGDTAEIAITVSGNPGIRALGLDIGFDDEALTLLEATDEGLFSGFNFTQNTTDGKLRSAFVGADPSDANGTLLTLKFRVNAGDGVYPVTVKVTQATTSRNGEYVNLSAKGVAGSVTVSTPPEEEKTTEQEGTEYLIGDVDFDGRVKSGDARLVLRNAAKLEPFSELQLLVADADGDGKIKAGDARTILRAAAKIEALSPATIILTA